MRSGTLGHAPPRSSPIAVPGRPYPRPVYEKACLAARCNAQVCKIHV